MPLAENALTTLTAVKEYLKITSTDKDGLFERLINSASDAIEKFCDRKFKKREYANEKHKGNNRQLLRLNHYPIVSVSSVTVNGNTYTQNVDFELDEEDAEAGMLFREEGWPASNYVGGLTQDPTARKRNIKVTYTAGYVLPKDDDAQDPRTLPYDLEQACILLVQYYYKTDIADFSTVFGEAGQVIKPSAMPPHVVKLIKKYQKID
jgi:uncharacterized phiE125 gp8 family phage protein